MKFLARNCQDRSRSLLKGQEYKDVQILSKMNRVDALLFSLQTHVQVGLVRWSPSDSPWRHSAHTACALLRPAKSLPMVRHYVNMEHRYPRNLELPPASLPTWCSLHDKRVTQIHGFPGNSLSFHTKFPQLRRRKKRNNNATFTHLLTWSFFYLVYLSIFPPFLPFCNSSSKLSHNSIF